MPSAKHQPQGTLPDWSAITGWPVCSKWLRTEDGMIPRRRSGRCRSGGSGPGPEPAVTSRPMGRTDRSLHAIRIRVDKDQIAHDWTRSAIGCC